MAIDGLSDLVNDFESSSEIYNNDVEKILEVLNNYVSDKSVENFLGDYIEKYPSFDGDISTMSVEDKEYTARKLAFEEHDKEIENEKKVDVKDKDGNVIGKKDANEVENFQQLLKEAREKAENKKKNYFNNKIESARNIQDYQAQKIEKVENELSEIKKELDQRKDKDKKLSEELKDIIEENSEFDKKIQEAEKRISEIKSKTFDNKSKMEQIKADDPTGYKKNAEYKNLMAENKELRKESKDLKDNIDEYKEQKENRKTEIEKEKADLKIEEYTDEYTELSNKIREAKDKYKENASKLQEKFSELGINLEEQSKINENAPEEVETTKDKDDNKSNEKEKKNEKSGTSNGTVTNSKLEEPESEKALTTMPSERQCALNKISQYIENPDPEERLDRLSHTDDYENLMSAMNNIGIRDYAQRKELKQALAENTKVLNDNMQETAYYIDMLEDVLGTKLSKSQKDLCKNMFNTTKDNKGRVNNILSGTSKFSQSDLSEMKNIINQVKDANLSPEQREDFENNFMKYVKMGSLNSQVTKNFASRFLYNKAPTKAARAERQLESSIVAYSNAKDKSQDKSSFFDYLRSGKESDEKYASLNPEYTSPRTKKVEKTR